MVKKRKEQQEKVEELEVLIKKDLEELEEQLKYIGQKVKQTQYYWQGESGELFRCEAEAIKKDVDFIIKQLRTYILQSG